MRQAGQRRRRLTQGATPGRETGDGAWRRWERRHRSGRAGAGSGSRSVGERGWENASAMPPWDGHRQSGPLPQGNVSSTVALLCSSLDWVREHPLRPDGGELGQLRPGKCLTACVPLGACGRRAGGGLSATVQRSAAPNEPGWARTADLSRYGDRVPCGRQRQHARERGKKGRHGSPRQGRHVVDFRALLRRSRHERRMAERHEFNVNV